MSLKLPTLQLILLFLSVIFHSYITNSYAESIPIVKELQKSYQSIKNFSATFTQELTHQESGSKETRIGKLFFKKPLLVRWETNTPHEELLLINTNAVWDYLPDENLVYKYSTDIVKDSTSIIQVITGQVRLDKNFSIIESNNNNNNNNNELIFLKLYPKEPTTQMVEAFLWVNKKSLLIHKVQSIDFYGNTNTITFIDITPNTHIDNNIFQFTPPKDVTVENLQDSSTPERPLFN